MRIAFATLTASLLLAGCQQQQPAETPIDTTLPEEETDGVDTPTTDAETSEESTESYEPSTMDAYAPEADGEYLDESTTDADATTEAVVVDEAAQPTDEAQF